MSAGKGDTIWLLLDVDSKRLLRQVDLSGQRIQELDLPPDLQTARKLCGSRDDEDLLLTIDLNPGERVIGLHFQNSKAQQSVWQKWLDRSMTPFRYFDVKNGQVVPVQEKIESPTVSIQLAENPLENGAPESLSLGVIADETGAWISTSDGLPLLQVTKTKNIVQTKWTANGVDGLQVFISNGSVVEEYRITGLENLYRFDAGSWNKKRDMGMSVGVTYSTKLRQYRIYSEQRVNDLINQLLRADLVVGFNIMNFDFEVLMGYTILDLPHQLRTLDLLTEVEKNLGGRPKLDNIAQATLGIGKTGDGIDAIKWWREKRVIEIAEYCCFDVKVTRLVHEFGSANRYIFYLDI